MLLAAADVAGQRHAAHAVEQFLRGLGRGRPHEPRAARTAAHELEREALLSGPVDNRDRLAERRPPAGVREDLPQPRRLIDPQKQSLPLPAGGGAPADEPGGHHPRVVDDDEVARREDLRQIADAAVMQRARRPVHDEQPRRGPVGERLLGDEVGGQVVVVEIGVGHALNRSGRAW